MGKNNINILSWLKGGRLYLFLADNILFVLFIVFLLIAYIYNGHKANNVMISMVEETKKMEHFQFEYKYLKKELMMKTREERLLDVAVPAGLYIPTATPPRILLSVPSDKKQ